MEKRLSLLYGALVSAALFAVLNLLALTFYFYWTIWWFDILMHFLGGLTGGLATYWVLFHSGHFFKKLENPFSTIFIVCLCVMTAGVAWEVMEYIHGIAAEPDEYMFDTALDIVMDVLGVVVAGFIGLAKTAPKQNSSINSL